MNPLTILDNITIASPCEVDWADMSGDDRTRFCSDCSRHVYNIKAMTADEAAALIIETQGNLCAQIYRRHDGTVLTADCPVGLRKISAGRRLRRALAVGIVLPGLAVAGVTAMGFTRWRPDPFPSGPGVTWDDQIDWALITLGLRQRPVLTGGMMALPANFTLPPASNTTTPVLPDCASGEDPIAPPPVPPTPPDPTPNNEM